jgi:hypothetical protein
MDEDETCQRSNLKQDLSLLSTGEQVQKLSLLLGFTQPAYHHTALPGSFYDAYATYQPADVRKEPRLGGQLGMIRHVYGRKAAQQECGRALLIILEQIRDGRLAGR